MNILAIFFWILEETLGKLHLELVQNPISYFYIFSEASSTVVEMLVCKVIKTFLLSIRETSIAKYLVRVEKKAFNVMRYITLCGLFVINSY